MLPLAYLALCGIFYILSKLIYQCGPGGFISPICSSPFELPLGYLSYPGALAFGLLLIPFGVSSGAFLKSLGGYPVVVVICIGAFNLIVYFLVGLGLDRLLPPQKKEK